MLANQTPIVNKLLAALPPKEYQHLVTDLEPVELTLGDILYEPGELIRHIYFPSDCLVSLLAVAEQHMALEVGLVGKEGVVGIVVALGGRISPVRAIVQRSGMVTRIKLESFEREMSKSPFLRHELYGYSHALMVQATQIAACSRFHTLEARLVRSLLMTSDRLQAEEFHLTHEFLASTLGVRRVGVTKAASALQQRKLIRYSRGEIKILDRKGLEAASCHCYQIIKDICCNV